MTGPLTGTAYADQAEKDYEAVLKAIRRGKIAVERGI